MSTLAAMLITAVAAVISGCGGQENARKAAAPTAAAVAASLYAPSVIEPARTAPEIALHNYTGQPLRLSQLREQAVLLTFIYDHCPDTCPLVVSKLHNALELLGARARYT